jgi:hypothetical protein
MFHALLVFVGVPLLMLVDTLLLCYVGAHLHPFATLYWCSSLPPCGVLLVLVGTSLLYFIGVHHHLFAMSLLCSIDVC